VSASNKRGRDDEDEQDPYGRPNSRGVTGDDIDNLKRRKTMRDENVGGAVGGAFERDPTRTVQRTRSAITQRARR